jgi:CheY-like chemotaxis protein
MINVGTSPETTHLGRSANDPDPSGRHAMSASQPTILVVDDEVDTRAALSEALVDAGYQVVLAANGRDGLQLLPSLRRPLGVILDLTMPTMSGLELYRIMKATPMLADIPVVISTSDPARAPRGVPLMRKPVSLERLLAAVARLF